MLIIFNTAEVPRTTTASIPEAVEVLMSELPCSRYNVEEYLPARYNEDHGRERRSRTLQAHGGGPNPPVTGVWISPPCRRDWFTIARERRGGTEDRCRKSPGNRFGRAEQPLQRSETPRPQATTIVYELFVFLLLHHSLTETTVHGALLPGQAGLLYSRGDY